jgi:hypothetical protein
MLGIAAALPVVLVAVSAAPQAKRKGSARPLPKAPTAAKPVSSAAAASFEKTVWPVVQQYCLGCHVGDKANAGIDLSKHKNAADFLKDRKVWEQCARAVSSGVMPPAGAPRPTGTQLTDMTAWIESTLSKADCKIVDPGRVTMRRLNREEYNNTIRDLCYVNLRPADEFPSDDVGYGFDNIGDVLTISPLLMEKYLSAAEKISKAAIRLPEDGAPSHKFTGADMKVDQKVGFANSQAVILFTNGDAVAQYRFPSEGRYLIRIKAGGQQVGADPCQMAIKLDDKELKTCAVEAKEEAPDLYTCRTTVPAGEHRVAAAFLNDFYDPKARGRKDRNLIISHIEIVGPLGTWKDAPESTRRIIFEQPTFETHETLAKKVLRRFATRAYRRPATTAEVDRLCKYVERSLAEGESFEKGIQTALQAVLLSPHFLFRVEIDNDPADAKKSRLLNDYELATRLSYFLWSSMPDDTLFALASEGRLKQPAVLNAQMVRMLKDPKSRGLAENFASQWLTLRNISNVNPNPNQFPEFNDNLRRAMRTETELFFDAVVREDRSILDFIDGNFSFVNEDLAKLYGLQGVSGKEFKRVTFSDGTRAGVLTHASILTVTSNPTRTSPVKRGKWVLEQMLGTPPPPAPPGAGELPDDKGGKLVGTLRQRMEQHRQKPLCASCHARMDPLGFGLENFDAIGRWRTVDGEEKIDASGELPDGRKFRGPKELRSILKGRKDLFVRNFAEKLLTYGLGRGLESYDKCSLDAMARDIAKAQYRFSSVVSAVVNSEPFRKRRGDGG